MDLADITDFLGTKIPFTDITLMNIVYAIIVLIVGYFVAILVSRWVHRAILHAKMTKILADFSSRVIRILILIFVIAIAVSNLGVDVGAAIISISVVGGFIFGFAFQDTLGNLAAGFMIAITKPFRKNDYVDMAGQSGFIKSKGYLNPNVIDAIGAGDSFNAGFIYKFIHGNKLS